jgi:hypothetical protein
MKRKIWIRFIWETYSKINIIRKSKNILWLRSVIDIYFLSTHPIKSLVKEDFLSKLWDQN